MDSELLFPLIVVFLLGVIVGRWSRKRSESEDISELLRHQSTPISLSAEVTAQVQDLLSKRMKIEAIKLVRNHAKCGLKDAKQYVESL